MAGPDNQQTKQFIIPPGEMQTNYAPGQLAQKIVNFEASLDNTLATVEGPTIYEPQRGPFDPASVFGEMHGIFHASLMGGTADVLLVRSGTKLYRHAGWARNWEEIYDGLTSDTRPTYPDQFLVLNDKIIWTNGIDIPLVIDAHGAVHPLGFSQTPSAPSVYGPAQYLDKQHFYPNAAGYSWRGDIGTPGDVLNGTSGAILDGAWSYVVQYEDIYGNLSAPSPTSMVVSIRTIQADPIVINDGDDQTGATIDDLTRQFLLRLTGIGPDHTVATHVYRTPDTRRASTIHRFLVRLPGRDLSVFGDRRSDADLGRPLEPTVAMPTFRTMCAHQGCLIIANTPADPGIVRRSSPGFPGTLPADEYIYPDTGGAEVTAVASHAGYLFAFTENAVYDISNFEVAAPVAQGVGCAAPRSIKALASGQLIWLARDGFYTMDVNRRITKVSVPIHSMMRTDLNPSRYRKAVAVVEPRSQEYRCAVPLAGKHRNTRMLAYDGTNWRRVELDMTIEDICQTDDYRQYVLFAGTYTTTEAGEEGPVTVIHKNVFVADHESLAFEPPARSAFYRSSWIYADATGMSPVHVRSLYLGMVDGSNTTFTIRFYRNGSWDPVIEMTDVLAIGVDDGSRIVTDIAGDAILGEAKTHRPRLFWRMVPVGLENANSWAFEIQVDYPNHVELAAFAFDQSAASLGNVRGRVPLRADR